MNLTCIYCNRVLEQSIKSPEDGPLTRAKFAFCKPCETIYSYAFPNDILLVYYDIYFGNHIFLRVCPNLDKAVVILNNTGKPYEKTLFKFKLNQVAGLSIAQLNNKIKRILPFL